MTGFEFMAVATIGMFAVGEVVALTAEYGPALIDQVKGWF
jgi:hypothetical protein